VLPLLAAPWLIRWLDAAADPASGSNAFERSRGASEKLNPPAALRQRAASHAGTALAPQRDAA
jgi:hypothetical protein